MKSKKLFFFTLIVLMLLMPAFNFNGILLTDEKGSSIDNNEDSLNIEQLLQEIQDLKTSSVNNNDKLDKAYQAANWIRNKFLASQLQEGGLTYLGQKGLAGIGEVFLELGYNSWAVEIGEYLLQRKVASGYPVGKWPNRNDFNTNPDQMVNYTGYEQGVAGIGTFLLHLYQATNDIDYLYEVYNIGTYLESLKKTTVDGKGYTWKERQSFSETGGFYHGTANKTVNGTCGSDFNDLQTVDGNYLDISSIDSNSNNETDVYLYVNLEDCGIPVSELAAGGGSDSIKRIYVELDLLIDTVLSYSQAAIFCPKNNTYEVLTNPISNPGLGSHSKTLLNNLGDYVTVFKGNYCVAVRINSSDTSNSHIISIDRFRVTVDYNSEMNSTSYNFGTPGIGQFYIELYKQFPTAKGWLRNATGAANWTISQADQYDDKAAWAYQNKYYAGITFGTAGVGNFMLNLHDEINGDTYYRSYAEKAANWLINNSDNTILYGKNVSRWRVFNSSSSAIYYVGMDYGAGIGQFLLDLANAYDSLNQTYFSNATRVANYLTSETHTVTIQRKYGYDLIYRWLTEGSVDYSYSKGGAGALYFLDNMRSQQNNVKFSKYISGGLEWFTKYTNITTTYWANTKTQYSFANGLGGVAYCLKKIDMYRPTIRNATTPPKLEFDQKLEVGFNISSDVALSKVFIRYAYGADYDNGIWTYQPLNGSLAPPYYFYTFANFSQNTTIHYLAFAEDAKGAFSFDNNGSAYVLRIVDENAPPTQLRFFFTGLGQNDNGTMGILVTKESARGAAFDYIRVRIPALGINDKIPDYIFDDYSSFYYTNYSIITDDTVVYNDNITVNVYTYDINGNELITSSIFRITDNFAPDITRNKISKPSQWIPQFVPASIEARVTDIGSGIDKDEGVFVLYSTDGENWNKEYLVRKEGSTDTYAGLVPGQAWLVNVYYIVGATDKDGNIVYVDRHYTTYSNYENIQLGDMDSYVVIVNLVLLLIIIGIISGSVLGVYLLYAKRGDYLSQMRRKSKATATGLVIKEKLNNAYYWLYDKFEILGKKIGGLGETFHTMRGWLDEHVSETTKNIFKGIGRFLYGIPKGIVNGIGNFFKGIGKIITDARAWKIIVTMVIGLAMLLTTVIQFVMEGGYPIRAVLFANLGFVLFITGLIIFLMRFIYKLAYK